VTLSLDEFREALGEAGRKMPADELRRAHVEAEILGRIVFDHLVPARRDERERSEAA
jgi:hypothetical protein